MKGNSDHYPERFIPTIGKIQFRYNIRKVLRKEIDGTMRECYDYDYVNVEKVTEKNLLEALKDVKNAKEIVYEELKNNG